MDLEQYKDSLIERFSNPAIADQVLRLAQDGSKKIPNMILEPVGEMLGERRPCPFACFALAAWIRFLEGTDEAGQPIVIDDPLGRTLTAAAQETRRGDVSPFFAVASVFPPGLAGHAGLKKAVAESLSAIRAQGMRAAVRKILA